MRFALAELGGTRERQIPTVRKSTISGNSATGNFAGGGGISNSRGRLTVSGNTISGNMAAYGGGGLHLQNATTTITNSTISGNTASGIGGGVYTFEGRTVIEHSTITLNTADGEGDANGGGDGVWSSLARTEVRSSIIAGNSFDDDVYTFFEAQNFVSLGYNLIGGGNSAAAFDQTGDQTGVTDPLLGLLQDNGGPTMTHALLVGSPAVDMGDPILVAGVDPTPEFDGRGSGFGRFLGGRIDIGAYELQSINQPPAMAPQSFHVDENQTAAGTVTADDPDMPSDSQTFSLTGNGPGDALFAITSDGILSEEWSSNRPCEQRIDNLRNGTGPVLELTGLRLSAAGEDPTVFDDGEQDEFRGDDGREWFLADLTDNVTDHETDEILDLL